MQVPRTSAVFPMAPGLCRKQETGLQQSQRSQAPHRQSQAVPSEGKGGSAASPWPGRSPPWAAVPVVAGLLPAVSDAHTEAPLDS